MTTIPAPDEKNQIIVMFPLADRLRRDYCCAGCWGQLTIYAVRDADGQIQKTVRVACWSCGDGRGFVTKKYAERRRSDSIGEALEVKDMLRQIGAMPTSKRSAKEILKELGF